MNIVSVTKQKKRKPSALLSLRPTLKHALYCYLSVLLLAMFSACTHTRQAKPFIPPAEGELSIVINIDGIKCCDGVLRLAVYNGADYWLSQTGLVRGRLGFIQGESQTLEIHGLQAGEYAVAVYQDLDSDNKFDRFLGLIPKEPYGFSNNVGRYGPVSFKKAAFNLTKDKTINIKLNSLK